MTVHDFNESLRRSHSASDLPIWLEIYRQAFPKMQAAVDHRQDGEHQRAGIDRSIILANAKQILIDEKVRWKDYGDIALEYLSDRDRNIPGWVCKPLRADYICYAIAPVGRAYLLPVPQLQQAWERHGTEWRAQFRQCNAPNRGYVTVSCAVPVPVLFKAMGECLRVSFTPQEDAA
jgi:hypothetical protein